MSSLRTSQGPITIEVRGYAELTLQLISKSTSVGYRSALSRGRRSILESLLRLREPVVERVAGAAHGADRILLAARIEQFAQPPDMHIHGALVDIDVAAPDAVEQLLAGKHPARMLEKNLQQPVFGRAEIDRTPRAPDAALLAIELDIAIAEHGGEPFGAGT